MTTEACTAADQSSLAIARAPSFCRLCNVDFHCTQTWPAHVKSSTHVYNLRLHVAEPGSVVPLPTSLAPTNRDASERVTSSRHLQSGWHSRGHYEAQDLDLEQENELPRPDIVARQCLFCTKASWTLDQNLRHMTTTHGFAVPFQECLAVNIETVLAQLHFDVHSCKECIFCGTQRRTVEGVRQHMIAKGHCRFDMTLKTKELYEVPGLDKPVNSGICENDRALLLLPSGKLVSHRASYDKQKARNTHRKAPDEHPVLRSSPPRSSPTSSLDVTRRHQVNEYGDLEIRSQDLLTAQLSKLRMADVRLRHREENRWRGRLERTNNTVLFKHYRLDSGDSRIGRQF